jgi:hypothetical protein
MTKILNAYNGLYLLSIIVILSTTSCKFLSGSIDAITGATDILISDGNSHFHQTEEKSLLTGELQVTGEVERPGSVNLNNHYTREVIIKQAVFDQGTKFTGAFRYRGYSLFDILHPFIQQKKNAEEFRPATDLYITIENNLGEIVVFSWSEIFHTSILHQVLIASEVAPIVPYRQEVDYETGTNWKVVCATDLYSYRFLENPVRIEVKSFDKRTYLIDRESENLYSPSVNVLFDNGGNFTIEKEERRDDETSYFTTFYGMGMGYHESNIFKGPVLNKFMEGQVDMYDKQWNGRGLVCFAGIDGYRAVYSFSELFNRLDQVMPILAISDNIEKEGYFRIFHPSSFYADRSVKSLSEIYLFQE